MHVLYLTQAKVTESNLTSMLGPLVFLLAKTSKLFYLIFPDERHLRKALHYIYTFLLLFANLSGILLKVENVSLTCDSSSTNKTDRYDITEMLLKVELSTINHKPTSQLKYCVFDVKQHYKYITINNTHIRQMKHK